MEKPKEGHGELQANIRRLTIMVLDNLEEGTKENTLDQAQKRLLSSTGARLLRLRCAVLREGGSKKVAEELERIEAVQSIPAEVKPNARDE